MIYTIHKDKPISLETVKLLGIPFTWGVCYSAFKYVPTERGLVTYRRKLKRYSQRDGVELIEDDPNSQWVRLELIYGDLDSIAACCTDEREPLYRVTFHDEDADQCPK